MQGHECPVSILHKDRFNVRNPSTVRLSPVEDLLEALLTALRQAQGDSIGSSDKIKFYVTHVPQLSG